VKIYFYKHYVSKKSIFIAQTIKLVPKFGI